MRPTPTRTVCDDDDDDAGLEPVLFMDFVEKRLGPDVAAIILRECGGTEVNVPTEAREHHRLCRLIGLDNTKIISRDFGFGPVRLPLRQFGAMAVRHAAIKQACREGRTTTSIVKEFRASARTVHKIRARLRREEGLA